MRTDNRDLTIAIEEVRKGKASSATLSFLRSLQRPLVASAAGKTTLFATNFDAWAHNVDCLSRWPGEDRCYKAMDWLFSPQYNKALEALPVSKVCIHVIDKYFYVIYLTCQIGMNNYSTVL